MHSCGTSCHPVPAAPGVFRVASPWHSRPADTLWPGKAAVVRVMASRVVGRPVCDLSGAGMHRFETEGEGETPTGRAVGCLVAVPPPTCHQLRQMASASCRTVRAALR
jgi:hypothetical protein